MIDLKKGAWVVYQPEWLEKDRADELLSFLLHHETWEHRAIFARGKEVLQPRLMSWGGSVPYHYSGQTLPVRPIPAILQPFVTLLSEEYATPFNHVVINRYRNGRDHMSSHADNEPELGRCPLIAAISLGQRRRFQLVPKAKYRKREKRSFQLEHGSLLVMGGNIQHHWRHAVPKNGADIGERLNITFRYLKGPPGYRDPLPKDGSNLLRTRE